MPQKRFISFASGREVARISRTDFGRDHLLNAVDLLKCSHKLLEIVDSLAVHTFQGLAGTLISWHEPLPFAAIFLGLSRHFSMKLGFFVSLVGVINFLGDLLPDHGRPTSSDNL
jgi:hypothetical protein